MSAPLSTTGGVFPTGAWQELEEVFAELGQLARSATIPDQFYSTLLEESMRALSASGGAVWLRTGAGPFEPAVQLHWPVAEFARDERARRAHERVLADAANSGRIVTIPPQSIDDGYAANPTSCGLVIGPVRASPNAPETLAIIELLLPADTSPAVYRGSEEFLTVVCELSADFHTFDELRRLRQGDNYKEQLIELGKLVHRRLDLAETAYAVSNEGRRVIGCDRLSVLSMHGSRCRLLATSGVAHIERRSGAARRLEELAEMVRRTDEPAYYTDGTTDAMPPIAALLEQHAEESHARQIAAIPMRPPADPEVTDRGSASRGRRQPSPRFVLVAEQFNARHADFHRERLVEVAQVCTTALENAWEIDRLPLGVLWRWMGAAKDQATQHISRTALVVGAAATAVCALVFLPADFNIDAPGTLQPIVRRDVFAPRSGLVDEVLVEPGAHVIAGQPLVRLRDAELDMELKKVHGELETTQRQIAAVRATRTNRAVRDANPTDAYRLSAEERELDQRLANLRQELELLNRERDKLAVVSPIAGNVLTWEVGRRLNARPVERGEVLLTVANLAADWRLELEVPDDRIGHVLAAQQKIRPDLAVRYRLSSDDREIHAGRISEVCPTADVPPDEHAPSSPTVQVRVALDPSQREGTQRSALRPGVSVRAQIECGRRPLGYVWLHDIWDAAWEWIRF